MKLIFELLPVILFFAGYKLYALVPPSLIEPINKLFPFSLAPGEPSHAIYFATLIAIMISGLITLVHAARFRKFNKNQLLTFILFLVFGGATLFLRDPVFIKWKPTVINLLFAALFLGSSFIGNKSLVERFMGNTIQAPKAIWAKLNLAWIFFFISIAVLNIFVAYRFSEDVWVNFKLFGVIGLTLLFIIIQMMLLSRHVIVKPNE